MAEPIRCVLLMPTGTAYRWLRRYLSAGAARACPCGPHGYHHAMARIEDAPVVVNPSGGISIDPLTWPESDPRWPDRCDHCDYRFHENEVRQLFYERAYRGPDGREYSVHGSQLSGVDRAPPGSMWHADWYPWKGPDGHCLVVRTPGGDWVVDGPSNNGSGWTRTGVAPDLTVTPSIDTGRYHGFLTGGKLIPC